MKKETREDCTLIRIIDEGMYDLCVDTGDKVTQITDEFGFEKIREPTTKFVMRVVLTEEVNREDDFKTYTCPRCKKDMKVERRSTSASIDWYDLPDASYDLRLRCGHATKCQ